MNRSILILCLYLFSITVSSEDAPISVNLPDEFSIFPPDSNIT